MNLRLGLLQIYVPGSLRKRTLKDLFRITANAFQRPLPAGLEDLSYRELLSGYADFMHQEVRRAVAQHQRIAVIKERLFRNAFGLGTRLRKDLRINSLQEFMTAGKILYRLLGISFEGNTEGEIVIRQCFFSRVFSKEDCRIISSLDEGVAAGLSGGGKLVFTQRITEGKPSCNAVLTSGGSGS